MFSKQLQVGFLASVRLGKGRADILYDRVTTKNRHQSGVGVGYGQRKEVVFFSNFVPKMHSF